MPKGGTLRITTVAENTSGGPGILGEWGLAILIEDGRQRILFDTGAGSSTLANLDALGVDPASLDAILLSHGHADHTGGLLPLLVRRRKEIPVFAHPAVWQAKYSRDRSTGRMRYAGIPWDRRALEGAGARFELQASPRWLSEDMVASGEEPMTTDFEAVAGNLYVASEGGLEPDQMIDDQSLYIRSELGLIVVLGCAHRGMVNIIEYGRRLLGVESVYIVLGGTHLAHADEQQLVRTIEALRRLDVRWLGVSHCTGQPVAARLAREFEGRFFFNSAGTRVSFPFEA